MSLTETFLVIAVGYLGYPHRMRFKAFNSRYRLLAPFKQLRRVEDQAVDDLKLILQNAQLFKSKFGASTSWALGRRHIFLSEGIRQQLENLRHETRRKAATIIQVILTVPIKIGQFSFNNSTQVRIKNYFRLLGEATEYDADGLCKNQKFRCFRAFVRNKHTWHRPLSQMSRETFQRERMLESAQDHNRSLVLLLPILRKNALIEK